MKFAAYERSYPGGAGTLSIPQLTKKYNKK